MIHCHQPVGGVMGRLVAKKFKLPCIYTAHGFHFFKGAPLKNRLIFKTVEKYCSKFTTALITMNNEDFENASKMKAKKVYQINGIGLDLSKYKKIESFDKASFKTELGIQKDEFVIVTVAEFIKRKNYNTMLETIKELGDKKVKFLICGRGQQEQEIKDIIERDNLKDKVSILGYRKDVDKMLQVSDCFFLPSFQEGLTLSIIEAMTFGLPVITSTARGNKDLIIDGVNGFVAEPKDYKTYAEKITTLMEDKNLQKEMSKSNKKDCQNYDISVVIEQMKKVYEESL
jgi:glycosyltransferase involved in cell wall biosynthesis